MKIQNPILRGFHPDPSLLRVKDDYYIAVSTFEWCPSVRIYHSRDLAHWEYFCSPLDGAKADLRGTASSDGIWAPCLSHDGSYFYLIYTISHNAREFPTMDMSNYLMRAENLKGPWSSPVYLNSSGFDPSLFHDEDGKKYLLNMEWDYREDNGKKAFAGILLQEYDTQHQCLAGEPRKIFFGTEIGRTEGPHLYKHQGFYYLICAEGGTGWFHAVTVARSRKLEGPYEEYGKNPIVSSWKGYSDGEGVKENKSKKNVKTGLQKAGHASLVETEDGRWYMAHLCARPAAGTECCPMGRETALEEVEWKDGWPVLKAGGYLPQTFVQVPSGEETEILQQEHKEYHFGNEDFLKDFQTLRIPYEMTGMTIHERPGCLRIYGQESIYSRFYQALLARRQTELCFCAGTRFEFHPLSYQHCAGLIYRYDEKNQIYACVTYEENWKSEAVCLWSVVQGKTKLVFKAPVKADIYELEMCVDNCEARLFYIEQGQKKMMGSPIGTCHMSDDYANGFTGCFVGMCVQDLRSRERYADFRSFWYDTFPGEQEKLMDTIRKGNI